MRRLTTLLIFSATFAIVSAVDPVVEPSYAWRIDSPLGNRQEVSIDTLVFDYGQLSIPSAAYPATATTGNLGAETRSLIYFDRSPYSQFFFKDALSPWIPSLEKIIFYNTRIPMTQLSYNFGGGKQTGQDRLKADFSGNINAKAQVGAMLDYIHSKGSYANQAAKNLAWGFSGSYIGDRYSFQGFYYHYNSINLENGGITDDLYITDPAEVQGGITSVDTKNIPTRLSMASSRVTGGQLYLNNRYNLGFHREEEDGDTVVSRFVPVTAFSWTLDFRQNRHEFHNSNSSQAHEFWKDFYLNDEETRDRTTYSSIRNTFGVSLLEGFNKYAQAGLSAYIAHEYRRFNQTPFDITNNEGNEGDDSSSHLSPLEESTLTPLPFTSEFIQKKSQNLVYVGAELARTQGEVLNYRANAEFGIIGASTGEIKLDGDVTTRFKLLGDTVALKAYAHFSNTAVPYLLTNYISNHFAWENDFGKTRRVRFGGELNIDRTSTYLNIGVENVQNLVYFNSDALPVQHSGSVQVFSATLRQNLSFKALHWNNAITYQKSADNSVIPLPQLSVYSNLYVYFRIAKVLQVQFGVDCTYYTKYKALDYQPATMVFYNQNEYECGNYPFMNLYLNMKLKRARFYVMMSHINQGLTGKNYFSMPHYPLNPRRFQLGISIDFIN